MKTALPLLLLPGLLCDDAVWRAQRVAFASWTRVVVADYGLRASLPAMASHALSLMPPGPIAVAGHSMGGRVALEVWRQAPERVDRLALLDTGYQGLAAGSAGATERQGRQRLLYKARHEGMRAMGIDWARGMVHPSRLESALFEDILQMIERKTPEIFEAQIEALLARPDTTALLGAIGCSTLVACGRDDAWSPLSRHEEMHAAIAGSRLAVIEHSGHMSTMEQADEVTRCLTHWLEEGRREPPEAACDSPDSSGDLPRPRRSSGART